MLSNEILISIAALLTSFAITYLAIPKIIHFSNQSRLFASVGDRHSHKGEVPIFGGIAIFAGILFSLLFWADLEYLQFALVSLVIVFIIGVIDDLLSLSPLRKLVGQIISILIIIYLGELSISDMKGIFGITVVPEWISVIFTIFVVIVITNAINLIDGIDGLAGGLGILSSSIFGIIFLLNPDESSQEMAILSFTLTGALFAFLRYNFNPASIFMGDTGSLLLGLILSILAIKVINTGVYITEDIMFVRKGPFVAIAILSVPLYDTFRVFFMRVFNGKHPLHPDRTHIHHVLLDLGFGHKKVSLIICFVNLLIIILSFFMLEMSLGLSIFILSILLFSIMSVPFIILQIKNRKSE